MADNIIVPTILVLSLTLGTLSQLTELAETSSAKAVQYSEDMTNAIDCAYTARPLSECSPNLFSTDFKEDVAQTQAILKEIKAQQPGGKLKTEADLPKKEAKKRA